MLRRTMASTKRTYGDRCGIARALDLVGERWALLVVRELLLGPKRFTDLRDGLPHMSPDVLSQRLRDLEAAGVLHRRTLAPPAGSRVYELTDWGLELEPVLLRLGRWGSQAPVASEEAALGVDAAVLALKTLFDSEAADGVELAVELVLDEQPFSARVADGRFSVARGGFDGASSPDATILTDPGTLAAVLWHGRDRRALAIGGDRATAERFLGLFPPAHAART
jgi:DNA-binding HxlR family transcriptional regulator